MTRLFKYCSTLFYFLPCFSFSQNSVPTVQWQKCLGGTKDDVAYSIQRTSDAGFVVAGSTMSNDGDVSGIHGTNIFVDMWVVKLDSNRNIEWQKALGGSGEDYANIVKQTSDGGYIVAGRTESNDGNVSGNHGLRDVWVVRLNANGTIKWQRCYGGTNYDENPNSLILTSTGGFIIAASTTSNNGDVIGNHNIDGSQDCWILNIDSVGNILSQKCIGGSSVDQVRSFKQTSEGGYIMLGYTYSNDGDVAVTQHPDSLGGSPLDFWVVKMDNNFNIQWQKAYGGDHGDAGFSIEQTLDGGYIAGGTTSSFEKVNNDVIGFHGGIVSGGQPPVDIWIVKLNAAGEMVWNRAYGGTQIDQINGETNVQQTPEGGYVVSGITISNDGDVSDLTKKNNFNYWILHLNGVGNILWQKQLGGSNSDLCTAAAAIANDNTYLLAGYTQSTDGQVYGLHKIGSAPSIDFWVTKLSYEVSNPAISITSNKGNNVCIGTPVTFTATITNGGSTPNFQWLKNGNYVGNNVNTYIDSTLKANDTIYCKAIADENIVYSNKFIFIVNAPPAKPTITSNGSITNICPGQTVTLTSTTATSYLWSNGASTQSVIVNSAGSYTVTVFNASGCSAISKATKVTYKVCGKPATVGTSSITGTSAKLTWKSVQCAVAYQLQYRKGSTGTFTSVNTPTTDTAYTLTSLLANTAYQWKVATICQNSPLVVSAFSKLINFTTAAFFASLAENAAVTTVTQASLYPNPVKDKLTVEIYNTITSNAGITIISAEGKTEQQLTKQLQSGNNKITIPVAGLANGTYLLRITTNEGQQVLKFVKE